MNRFGAVSQYVCGAKIFDREKEGDVMKVSSLLIRKSVTACAGLSVIDIRKTAGGLFIETQNDQQGI